MSTGAQEAIVAELRRMAEKVQGGMYGVGDDLDTNALAGDLEEMCDAIEMMAS